MWDFFFFSGTLPLLDEIQEEVRQLFLQPKGQLFFDRAEGTDIFLRENSPSGIRQEIDIRFDIVNSAARRNTIVDNGEETGRDKRIATSQFAISFRRPDQGTLKTSIGYFILADLSNFQDIEV